MLPVTGVIIANSRCELLEDLGSFLSPQAIMCE